MSNRLSRETSPYLLQHAENPVQWYPWGAEAWEEARRQQKPIFLSIGYSSCHWCHVMAHESFENPDIAGLLNEHFIAVKVDREERPEVDQIYMEAVQMMNGQGGWPLSVFLTPDLEPFFGGTYWPVRPRGGMPGFADVLRAVADAWQRRRPQAIEQARTITELLGESSVAPAEEGPALDGRLLEGAESLLAKAFDSLHGGFGSAPKFPQPVALRLLLRRWRRTGSESMLSIVTQTLDAMAAGGIYDQLGGGFHRYSTDARWLAPHFEKMLYDNALLAACYVEAWQATGNPDYARVARETLDYLLRDMTDPAGAFYSSEDADSEGHEGVFYLWTPDEVRQVLGPEQARRFCYVYDVTDAGNFEGRNILHRAKTLDQCASILGCRISDLEGELADDRHALLEARNRRIRPGRDDKVLADWNGLLIEALALAGGALGEPRYLDAAAAAADFLLMRLRRGDGRLLHAWRSGRAAVEGLLDDYATLANGLVTLYEARFEERWIDEAVRLADELLRLFADTAGGFFTAAADHPALIVRKQAMIDSSLPSGGGLATLALLRLGKLCGRTDYLAAAEAALQSATRLIHESPSAAGQMLLGLDLFLGPTVEIVILAGDDRRAMAESLLDLRRRFLPSKVVAFRDPSRPPQPRSPALAGLFAGKEP
ncbi:MAG: thioredoxin domain-containing protein, partial [Tepidisphaeraceae bacterium]